MKRIITFSLLIVLLISPLHCLASGTSFSETSNTVNKKVQLQNLVTEYLSQEAKDTPRVVSEVISLWNNNGIKMTLPEKEYGARINEGRSHDEYILIKGNDHDSFEILYSIHYDASRDNLCIYIPHTYRHLRKAFATVISYYTGYDISDSYTIYDNLKKSIINSKSQKIIDNLGIYLTVTSKREILEVERSASIYTTPTEMPSEVIKSTIDYFSNLFSGNSSSNSSTPSPTKPIIDLNTFLYDFNFYSAFMGNNHRLSTENVEISIFTDSALIKKVFNGCEILSLITNKSMTDIVSIKCTLSTTTPGSDKYTDDFLSLLMESMLAAGMDSSSASDVFTKFGTKNAFKIGDSGKETADGLTVDYSVTNTVGISFTIEKIH